MLTSTLNLGILAHVDAGKTTLTERLLYAAGVIDEVGSVDDGTTQTDSLALERQRGITIKSAVVSFAIGGVTVNLIDTPGHPDFIAEVERALSVLDGAVLVISAVEGVQPQTRILMRALQRLRVPALLFVNKIDRRGAGRDRVLAEISQRLTPAVVAMGSATGLGTRAAGFTPFTGDDGAFTTSLAERLAEHSEAIMCHYVNGGPRVPLPRLRGELAAQVRQVQVHPVYFGSALTGAGVDALMTAVAELLPAARRDPGGPVSGRVFKIERGAAGEKLAYVRMFSGTVRVRDRVRFGPVSQQGSQPGQRGGAGKVTAISVFADGGAARRECVSAGEIGRLGGLAGIQVGDVVGVPHRPGEQRDGHQFAPPTLETVVVPRDPRDSGPLRVALGQLAEQDPLINVRQDGIRQEILVSLYGEVQKEVIQATLASDFGLQVGFRESTTLCIERPSGHGSAAEFMSDQDNPFRATAGLRIDPAPAGSGVRFRLGIEPGALPVAFQKAIEETVRDTLREGLAGWPVTDCTITLTHSGYTPPPPFGWSKWSTSAADFRHLTPLVLMTALRRAGTQVYEPIHRFSLDIPADTYGRVLPLMARLGAVPGAPQPRGSSCLVEGDIPAARVHELEQQLPALTRGEAVLDGAFDRYQMVPGRPPARPRSDYNPLHRKEYLLHVKRRVI